MCCNIFYIGNKQTTITLNFKEMRVLKFLAAGMMAALVLASCGGSQPRLEGVSKGEVDSASYAVGFTFGKMISDANIVGLDYSVVEKAMKDVLSGKKTMLQPMEANTVVNEYIQKCQVVAGQLKEKEQAEFLAKNKKNEGVEETASGLQYKIDNPGNEVRATAQDTVEVHYKGTLLNGNVFDSSYDRGETVKFPLNRVIAGWTEGMQLVGEGGKITLWVPFNLGYGARAMSEDLPAYSTLVFDVELVKIFKAEEKKETK